MTTRWKHTTRGALATAALALTMVSVACGGGTNAADDDVASLGKQRPPAEQTSDEPTDKDRFDAMVEHAQCMRDNGVDVPDPQMTEDGGISLSVDSSFADTMGDDEAMAATEACKELQQKVIDNMPKPSPEDLAESRDELLAFAKCMRDKGADYPDPTINEDGIPVLQAGDVDGDDPAFRDASAACAKATDGGGGPAIAIEGS